MRPAAGIATLVAVAVVAPVAAVPSVTENKTVARRYFEEILNQGRLAVADELVAPDVRFDNPPVSLTSREQFKGLVKALRSGFPDLTFRVDDVIAEGDKVATRWTLTGTHTGDLGGRPPSGKAMTVTGMDIFLIKEGRIQQIWVNMDVLGQAQQLGWMPSPSPSPR